jgi:hypothetical protein
MPVVCLETWYPRRMPFPRGRAFRQTCLVFLALFAFGRDAMGPVILPCAESRTAR